MASFQVTGFIDTVKYLPDSCIVVIDEFKRGYKTADGKVVEDKYMVWKTVFKGYFKKFISQHFKTGQLVEVKGEVSPYAVVQGKVVDGYAIMGQTINAASYPTKSVKQVSKMIRESQQGETPNLDEYNTPDF